MLCNPREGWRVRVWYRKALAVIMPLHGMTGIVRVVCKGRAVKFKPRNHGIEIDDRMYTVPSGHLNKAE